MEEKIKIRPQKAQEMLLKFNDDALWEYFMQMLYEFFSHEIYGVLTAHNVAKNDGTVYGELDEEQWYDDDICEKFLSRCYQQIANDIYKTHGIKAEEL